MRKIKITKKVEEKQEEPKETKSECCKAPKVKGKICSNCGLYTK